MFKNNKLRLAISSVIILLPIIFGLIMWNNLPNTITTHWGADGNADGFSTKAFAVFGLPLILLIVHFICLFFTFLDKKQKNQSPKIINIIFWIVPIISLWANGIIYCTAFGKEVDFALFVPIVLGLMLIFMGNYLPKTKQNRTFGIKIYWTLRNEENWNKTHRLGGKIYFVGGIALLFSVFFPLEAMLWIMICVIAAIVIIPIGYSYYIYKQHIKEGIVYLTLPKSKSEKISVRISILIAAIVFIGIGILMFTGDIEVSCEDTSFKINTTYWTDIEIDYSDIDTIEYRKDLDVGIRTSGYGSPRLSMGIFQNDEFGSYTLYAYTGAKEYVVLTSDEKNLVIGMSDTKETQIIYDTISKKING